jgi:hypothetical protein
MTLVATTPLTLLIKIIVNASEVLYFRISVTIFRFSFLIFTPFHFPPRGKGFDTPSPANWRGRLGRG